MKRTILTALLTFAFGIGLALLTAAPSMAVHKGSGDLTCGACHTMHSSQGGTSTPSMGDGSAAPTGSGSFVLLRTDVTTRENLHNFCLQCHSEGGAQAGVVNNGAVGAGLPGTTPPKVHLTTNAFSNTGNNLAISWNGASFTNNGVATGGTGGGGMFNGAYTPGTYTPPVDDTSLDNALGRQHSIGVASATPPGNSTDGGSTGTPIGPLSCTTCHDPHGVRTTSPTINKYRNLKAGAAMPTAAQNKWTNMLAWGDLATSYVGGVTNTSGVANNFLGTNPNASYNLWPVINAAATTQNTYRTSNTQPMVLGTTTIVAGTNNVGFSGFCAQCHGAWHEEIGTNSNRSGDDWKRHPVNNSLVDVTPLSGGLVSIVEFATHYNLGPASAAPYTTTVATKLPAAQATAAGTTYYADDSADKVFCLSCHFSHGSRFNDILRWNYTSAVQAGSQTGNAIASNVGCQQCHNR